MNNHQLSIYGTRYFDTEPLYLTTSPGVRVWDRVNKRWLNWESLVAKAADEGHTWQDREVGLPSILWQLTHMFGHEWAPGLDDTSGLASESITNGEVWTDAAGTTPPTGWTVTSGTPDFNTDGDWLNFINANDDLAGLNQEISGLDPDTYYVLEVVLGGSTTTANTTVSLSGFTLPLGPWDQPGTALKSASFKTDAAGTASLHFNIHGVGSIQLRFVRMYLESELTGSGGALVTTVPPARTPIVGPFPADGTNFWINTDTCKIGFNLDSDPAADFWLTSQEVCDSDLSNGAKLAISAQLDASGCGRLPCVRADGRLKRSYASSE